jgi:hypothetical protein
MFWEIVAALVFVFFILPLIAGLLISITNWLIENLGCVGTVVLIVILLLTIIF